MVGQEEEMTDNSREAFTVIAEIEGGDKLVTDAGGLTKYGIASKYHPDVDIANLTFEGAYTIFKAEYWDAVRGSDLPWPLNAMMADAAFNQGVQPAGVMLQAALGIPVDGRIG